MIQKNKSNKKLSPIKGGNLVTLKDQQPLLKGKWDQTPVKLNGNRSFYSRSSKSLSKSKGKQQRSGKENKELIQKQFTKQTYKRGQQKLNICTKIEQLIEQIKQRQSKLRGFFQIYRILQSQTGHQRCLQHNNDLSLYCQTQNKILCVHCIYGASKHKTHKVVPLKDSIKQISKDINNLQHTIETDIDTIRIKIRTSQSNQSFIQRHYRQQVYELQKKYNDKLHELQIDFCQKKQYLNEHYDQLIKKNLQLTNSLKAFQKNVHLKLGIIRKDDNHYKPVIDMKQVSKQTILTKISELTDFKGFAIEDVNEKDLGQNVLRSRIKTDKK